MNTFCFFMMNVIIFFYEKFRCFLMDFFDPILLDIKTFYLLKTAPFLTKKSPFPY